MTVLEIPVPSNSFRSWQNIATGCGVFCVQERTAKGLAKNEALRSRLWCTDEDLMPFRIIFTTYPVDFVADERQRSTAVGAGVVPRNASVASGISSNASTPAPSFALSSSQRGSTVAASAAALSSSSLASAPAPPVRLVVAVSYSMAGILEDWGWVLQAWETIFPNSTTSLSVSLGTAPPALTSLSDDQWEAVYREIVDAVAKVDGTATTTAHAAMAGVGKPPAAEGSTTSLATAMSSCPHPPPGAASTATAPPRRGSSTGTSITTAPSASSTMRTASAAAAPAGASTFQSKAPGPLSEVSSSPLGDHRPAGGSAAKRGGSGSLLSQQPPSQQQQQQQPSQRHSRVASGSTAAAVSSTPPRKPTLSQQHRRSGSSSGGAPGGVRTPLSPRSPLQRHVTVVPSSPTQFGEGGSAGVLSLNSTANGENKLPLSPGFTSLGASVGSAAGGGVPITSPTSLAHAVSSSPVGLVASPPPPPQLDFFDVMALRWCDVWEWADPALSALVLLTWVAQGWRVVLLVSLWVILPLATAQRRRGSAHDVKRLQKLAGSESTTGDGPAAASEKTGTGQGIASPAGAAAKKAKKSLAARLNALARTFATPSTLMVLCILCVLQLIVLWHHPESTLDEVTDLLLGPILSVALAGSGVLHLMLYVTGRVKARIAASTPKPRQTSLGPIAPKTVTHRKGLRGQVERLFHSYCARRARPSPSVEVPLVFHTPGATYHLPVLSPKESAAAAMLSNYGAPFSTVLLRALRGWRNVPGNGWRVVWEYDGLRCEVPAGGGGAHTTTSPTSSSSAQMRSSTTPVKGHAINAASTVTVDTNPAKETRLTINVPNCNVGSLQCVMLQGFAAPQGNAGEASASAVGAERSVLESTSFSNPMHCSVLQQLGYNLYVLRTIIPSRICGVPPWRLLQYFSPAILLDSTQQASLGLRPIRGAAARAALQDRMAFVQCGLPCPAGVFQDVDDNGGGDEDDAGNGEGGAGKQYSNVAQATFLVGMEEADGSLTVSLYTSIATPIGTTLPSNWADVIQTEPTRFMYAIASALHHLGNQPNHLAPYRNARGFQPFVDRQPFSSNAVTDAGAAPAHHGTTLSSIYPVLSSSSFPLPTSLPTQAALPPLCKRFFSELFVGVTWEPAKQVDGVSAFIGRSTSTTAPIAIRTEWVAPGLSLATLSACAAALAEDRLPPAFLHWHWNTSVVLRRRVHTVTTADLEALPINAGDATSKAAEALLQQAIDEGSVLVEVRFGPPGWLEAVVAPTEVLLRAQTAYYFTAEDAVNRLLSREEVAQWPELAALPPTTRMCFLACGEDASVLTTLRNTATNQGTSSSAAATGAATSSASASKPSKKLKLVERSTVALSGVLCWEVEGEHAAGGGEKEGQTGKGLKVVSCVAGSVRGRMPLWWAQREALKGQLRSGRRLRAQLASCAASVPDSDAQAAQEADRCKELEASQSAL